jgi:cytochrome P450
MREQEVAMSTAMAPMPPGIPVMPGYTLTTLYAFRNAPLPMFARARDMGGVVRLPIYWRDAFAVTSPEAVQKLLSGSVENVWKGTRGARLLGRTLGPGLLTTDGPVWVARRKAAQPHFRKEAMDTWTAVVRRHAEALVGEWLATEGPVDVIGTANRTALRIVCEAMLGVELGKDDDVVAHALDTVLAGFLWMTTFPIDGVDRWPLPASIRHRRAVAELRGVVDRLVARRRAGEARDDVLGAWIAARDRGELDDDDLRAEVLTLLLAGHETTANAVAWTMGLLALHPDARDAVAKDAREGRTDLVDAAISEAMRLYPPAWIVARAVKEAVDLGTATIPAGAYVFVPIAAIHRDPNLWSDPDAFRLDRWTSAPAKGTYLPFGWGPRRCIGEHFAKLEAREIVAAVLRRATLEPAGPLPEPDPSVTMRPKGGLRVRVVAT